MTRQRQAFTLIELLVALAIIVVVLGIALPTLSSTRDSAQETFDLNNTRQTGIALHAHAADHRSKLPALERISGVNKSAHIKSLDSRGTWIDVLLNKRYAESPLMFTDSSVDTSGDAYPNAIGLIRYHYSMNFCPRNIDSNYSVDLSPPFNKPSIFSPYTWSDRGVRNLFGPNIESIAHPGEKFMAAEAVTTAPDGEGSPWAGLSAWRGTANIRHRNNTGHYAYYDGHVAALSFEQVFGAPYDEDAKPIGPAPADNWLYNMRHLGMTGGFNNKQYGHHFTSAEAFPAWAAWVP